ncbi:unnamed protein product, partial [Ectocarpus sp. 12 AP-2014]
QPDVNWQQQCVGRGQFSSVGYWLTVGRCCVRKGNSGSNDRGRGSGHEEHKPRQAGERRRQRLREEQSSSIPSRVCQKSPGQGLPALGHTLSEEDMRAPQDPEDVAEEIGFSVGGPAISR